MGKAKDSKPKQERQLTEAEIRRSENFKVKEADLLEKGYVRNDLTISIEKANTVGALLTLPFVAVMILGYALYNHGEFGIMKALHDNLVLYFIGLASIIVSFFVCAVIHEGIHGLIWGAGAENGYKDIEFGFIKEKITPYCTCLSPLKKPLYIFGSLMPMTILGIVIGVVSIFLGNVVMLIIGCMQTLGGAGDILVTFMLLRYKTKGKDTILMDHPTECGLVVFEKA